MKKITISIFSIIILTCITSCSQSPDEQSEKEKAIAAFLQKTLHLKKPLSELNDKFISIIIKTNNSKKINPQSITDLLNKSSYRRKNKGQFTFKESTKLTLTIMIFLFLIAKLKFDCFPSEEQKKLDSTKKSNNGFTGISKFSESLIIHYLCKLLR